MDGQAQFDRHAVVVAEDGLEIVAQPVEQNLFFGTGLAAVFIAEVEEILLRAIGLGPKRRSLINPLRDEGDRKFAVFLEAADRPLDGRFLDEDLFC